MQPVVFGALFNRQSQINNRQSYSTHTFIVSVHRFRVQGSRLRAKETTATRFEPGTRPFWQYASVRWPVPWFVATNAGQLMAHRSPNRDGRKARNNPEPLNLWTRERLPFIFVTDLLARGYPDHLKLWGTREDDDSNGKNHWLRISGCSICCGSSLLHRFGKKTAWRSAEDYVQEYRRQGFFWSQNPFLRRRLCPWMRCVPSHAREQGRKTFILWRMSFRRRRRCAKTIRCASYPVYRLPRGEWRRSDEVRFLPHEVKFQRMIHAQPIQDLYLRERYPAFL